jgi:hypothetical protein
MVVNPSVPANTVPEFGERHAHGLHRAREIRRGSIAKARATARKRDQAAWAPQSALMLAV